MEFESTTVAGFVGGVSGAALTLLSVVLNHWLTHRKQRALDKKRKALLLQMLSQRPTGVDWRKMDTLSGVIGASREETARLLIELGARSSETGEDVWALLSEKPLPTR